MTKLNSYTFDKWRKERCSEVRHLKPEDIPEYQSTYVYQFNYLKDRGWTYFNKRWVSPHPPHQTYGKIHLAFGAQKYKETLGGV